MQPLHPQELLAFFPPPPTTVAAWSTGFYIRAVLPGASCELCRQHAARPAANTNAIQTLQPRELLAFPSQILPDPLGFISRHCIYIKNPTSWMVGLCIHRFHFNRSAFWPLLWKKIFFAYELIAHTSMKIYILMHNRLFCWTLQSTNLNYDLCTVWLH